jgi:predicted transcriptional regulator
MRIHDVVDTDTFKIVYGEKTVASSSRANPKATKDRGHSSTSVVPTRKSGVVRSGKERVLVEFSESLLKRADEAARKMDKNRSELIRTAVEQLLNEIEAKKFEQELAAAYAANAEMNLSLTEEFAHVDSEGF